MDTASSDSLPSKKEVIASWAGTLKSAVSSSPNVYYSEDRIALCIWPWVITISLVLRIFDH